MTTNNTFTITLTPEQMEKFNSLKTTRQGKSDAELLNQVIDRGCYDLVYRSARNKKQWGMFKEWKATQKDGQ